MRNIPTVYRVPCPVCDALPGERCMFPGGQIKKWAHEQREQNAFQEEKTDQ